MKFFIVLLFILTFSLNVNIHGNPTLNRIDFLSGIEAHEDAYVELINKAREEIIIASWKAAKTSRKIFTALESAKERRVPIRFYYDREEGEKTIIDAFERTSMSNESDSESESESEETTTLKTHAKFLIVDKKRFIIGSYNALQFSNTETGDTSLKFSFNSKKDAKLFYMHLNNIYGFREPPANQNREPPEKTLNDGSNISLLVGVKNHEDFFKEALKKRAKNISIYSPFIYEDTLNERLKMLSEKIPATTTLRLYTAQENVSKLKRDLKRFPPLSSHSKVYAYNGHEKIMIIGDHTISVGSLNWLSGSTAENDHSNIEVSLVLQGDTAKRIIKDWYPEHRSSEERDDNPSSSRSPSSSSPQPPALFDTPILSTQKEHQDLLDRIFSKESVKKIKIYGRFEGKMPRIYFQALEEKIPEPIAIELFVPEDKIPLFETNLRLLPNLKSRLNLKKYALSNEAVVINDTVILGPPTWIMEEIPNAFSIVLEGDQAKPFIEALEKSENKKRPRAEEVEAPEEEPKHRKIG